LHLVIVGKGEVGNVLARPREWNNPKGKDLLVNLFKEYRTLYSPKGKENKAKPSSEYYMYYLYYF
jgi:hypothetical protein